MYTHGMAILEIIWCFINLGNEGFGETCFQVKLLGSSQCFFFWPEKFFFFIFKKKTRLWKIQAVRNTKGNIKSLVLPMVFLKKLLANQSFWVQKLYMFVILDQLILMVFLKKCSFRAIRPFWSRNWRTVIALFFFSNFEQWKRPGHRPTLY